LLPTIRRPGASRNLDYLGALLFTVAISLILVGLTNKIDQATFTVHAWTDFGVGGLIAIGAVLSVLFLFVESRAKEPIIPLDLWRNRTYVSSLVSTFLVSFGFFGAIIFLPRWFQVVRHESATASGYLTFPLLIGLIGSSIVSGQIVARTGRYKAVIIASITFMAVGLFLMTHLTADTDFPMLFLWMFITGIGIGPTLAVFTIVVQNAVPFQKLGVATSNLTFFRQIGGSVGLAIAGTAFAESLRSEIPAQVTPVFAQIKAAAPPAFQGQFDQIAQAFSQGAPAGLDISKLTGVGQSFGKAIADSIAATAGPGASAVHQLFDPFIPQLDHAFFQSFSLAIGSTLWIGLITTVVAIGTSLFMKELPLRKGFSPEQTAAGAGNLAGRDERAPQYRNAPARD
jgi:MFS family permease